MIIDKTEPVWHRAAVRQQARSAELPEAERQERGALDETSRAGGEIECERERQGPADVQERCQSPRMEGGGGGGE